MVWLICRINEVMDNLKMMLGYFFVGWITVVLWHLLNNSSSLDYTTSLFWCASNKMHNYVPKKRKRIYLYNLVVYIYHCPFAGYAWLSLLSVAFYMCFVISTARWCVFCFLCCRVLPKFWTSWKTLMRS